MSGTELSRLMTEVTAQPPVDVDFAAVARRVQRRDKRLRRTAAGAAVLAVAAIAGVPTVYGMSGQRTRVQSIAPPSLPVVTVDATWRHDSWNTLTWRIPAGWLPSAANPDHSRPSNALIEGPYIGNARLPVTSPSPRPVRGTGVLGSAGPELPSDAVVAWFSYGERSVHQLSDGSAFDDTTPPGLVTQCAQLGAGRIFHAVRQFGTQAHGSNLALDGCISATDPAMFEAELRAVLASAADSAYPSISLGTPPASATSAVADVAAIWDHIRWRMPSSWQLGAEPFFGSGPPGHLTRPRYLGPAPLQDPCTLVPLECNPKQGVEHVADGGVLASIAFGPILPRPGAPAAPDTGTLSTADSQCAAWGGVATFHAERDFGLAADGERVALGACLGNGYPTETLATLRTIAASVTDDEYGPMAAPTTPSPTASGTTAAALCTSALGPVASAELTTVGLIRTATWGPALADGKGRLADAFPGAKDDDPAAWCWQGVRLSYTAYAVHAGDAAREAAGFNGWSSSAPPSGPPMFP
ncbi:MAG: hypothetical protein QOJ11_2297 [Frankiales bacterium]|jgi:hypothetical protein|nr:hypothetical protein [Frankiales bacterium]